MISHKLALLMLRYSLGITFFWFGILKLFNASPVIEIVEKALPPMLGQSELFMFGLAFVEMLIGIAFLANRFVKLAAFVMSAHLLVATGSVLVTQGFTPRFPVLSLAGEFVVKNIVLIAAGFVLIAEKNEKAPDTETKK
jgi:uncharacterized membrane protein YkgB